MLDGFKGHDPHFGQFFFSRDITRILDSLFHHIARMLIIFKGHYPHFG